MAKYFNPSEYMCKCGCLATDVNPKLLVLLEGLREILGRPLIINSGFRCDKHNTEIGGGPEHPAGNAVDIKVNSSAERFELVQRALGMGFNRIGIANSFVHLGIDESLPQNVIWTY